MAILLRKEVVISGIDRASDVSMSKTESCIFPCCQGHVHMWRGGPEVVVVVRDSGMGVYKSGTL